MNASNGTSLSIYQKSNAVVTTTFDFDSTALDGAVRLLSKLTEITR